jgi:DNA modification methylase
MELGGSELVNQVLHGNSLEVLKTLEDNSVDSIVTDPPYELGFMGKKWDSTGIAYNVDLWKECLRVLKPGGHLLAFGGTRTYHRMVCAIEDAGFEIRDCIHVDLRTGFPKSHDISKAIDKKLGARKGEVGGSSHH